MTTSRAVSSSPCGGGQRQVLFRQGILFIPTKGYFLTPLTRIRSESEPITLVCTLTFLLPAMNSVSILSIAVAALTADKAVAFSTPKTQLVHRDVRYVPSSHLMASSSDVDADDAQIRTPTTSLPKWVSMSPFILSALAFSVSPLPSNAGDVASGQQVFTSTCAGCHAGGQNLVSEKKTLQKDAIEKYVGAVDEETVLKFWKGSFVHKVVGGKLSEVEVQDAVAYVVDQASGDKW